MRVDRRPSLPPANPLPQTARDVNPPKRQMSAVPSMTKVATHAVVAPIRLQIVTPHSVKIPLLLRPCQMLRWREARRFNGTAKARL